MAQFSPIHTTATTTGLTSGALGIYMHGAWRALLIMSMASLILMSYSHIKLLMGKRALVKQSQIKHRVVTKESEIQQIEKTHKFSQLFKPALIKNYKNN